MKRALVIAAALGLLLPTFAFAQDHGRDNKRPGNERPAGKPGNSGRPGHPGGGGGHPGGGGGRPGGGGGRPGGGHPGGGHPSVGHPGPGRPGPGPGRPGAGRPGVHPGPGRPGPGRPGGGAHYRPRGGQYYHGGHWGARIHGAPFIYPHGYAYRQWGIGMSLPGIFLAPNYFYPDYLALGLQAPLPGFSWVRYGPDLLLVNLATGAVVDVAYGVFL